MDPSSRDTTAGGDIRPYPLSDRLGSPPTNAGAHASAATPTASGSQIAALPDISCRAYTGLWASVRPRPVRASRRGPKQLSASSAASAPAPSGREWRGGAAAGALALVTAAGGAAEVAAAVIVIMVALLIDARRWVRLAGRSRIGASSEDAVRRALSALACEGWQLCHSLPYRGRGDIDSVAIAPTPASPSRSRPSRARSTHATWRTPARRPLGFTGVGGAGAVEARSRCCAWRTPAGLSMLRTRCSWCRWTGWRRRSEPAREPHPAPGSWPRRRLRAERELLRGLLVVRSGAGGGIGEHAGE